MKGDEYLSNIDPESRALIGETVSDENSLEQSANSVLPHEPQQQERFSSATRKRLRNETAEETSDETIYQAVPSKNVGYFAQFDNTYNALILQKLMKIENEIEGLAPTVPRSQTITAPATPAQMFYPPQLGGLQPPRRPMLAAVDQRTLDILSKYNNGSEMALTIHWKYVKAKMELIDRIEKEHLKTFLQCARVAAAHFYLQAVIEKNRAQRNLIIPENILLEWGALPTEHDWTEQFAMFARRNEYEKIIHRSATPRQSPVEPSRSQRSAFDELAASLSFYKTEFTAAPNVPDMYLGLKVPNRAPHPQQEFAQGDTSALCNNMLSGTNGIPSGHDDAGHQD